MNNYPCSTAFSYVLLWTILCTTSASEMKGLQLDKEDLVYDGRVSENGRTVDVTPEIKTKPSSAAACQYEIIGSHHRDLPFRIRVSDETTGTALVSVTRPLDCEKRQRYKIEFVAVGCDGQTSPRAKLIILVEDVNEFAPRFFQPIYRISVDEGRMYESILTVSATDSDCSHDYGAICSYDIITPDMPFIVDSSGIIRNTEPLIWSQTRSYSFEVVAYDCGQKESQPAKVDVTVARICTPGWKGIENRVSYLPGTGKKHLFPDAFLELCGHHCEPEKLDVTVTLVNEHIAKGCDRDTYSSSTLRKLCGASLNAVDLLPAPDLGTVWIRNLPTADGHNADPVYFFDGKTATIVPDNVLNGNFTHTFSIVVWIQHSSNASIHKHDKHHIFCSSDDHDLSRHHFSLFIRNCRLILLLRREYLDGDLNSFRPAEWRWQIPQVCDGKWHHYVINSDHKKMTLYIDGEKFLGDKHNPEAVDDWPLHGLRNSKTKFVVGACWQGSEQRMQQYFHGYLGGLSITRGDVEDPRVIHCLHSCKENLDFGNLQDLQAGTEVTFNSEMSEITLSAVSVQTLSKLVQNVSYVNLRDFPTPGHRRVKLATDIRCKQPSSMTFLDMESLIVVQQERLPIITIAGVPNIARGYVQLKKGVPILSQIRLNIEDNTDENYIDDVLDTISHQLDSCSLAVDPPLMNPDHEQFIFPKALVKELGLDAKQTPEGLIIAGVQKSVNYENVLRQLLYKNSKPVYYLSRTFRLKCSELSRRFNSNEFQVELSVIHTHVEPAKVHNAQRHPSIHVEMPRFHTGQHTLMGGRPQSSVAGNAITVIVVVCVGFLVFMIILGVIRIRNLQKSTEEATELSTTVQPGWDESSLTITVNPMQRLEGGDVSHGENDTDDDCNSDYNDDTTDDDIDSPSTEARHYEWEKQAL